MEVVRLCINGEGNESLIDCTVVVWEPAHDDVYRSRGSVSSVRHVGAQVVLGSPKARTGAWPFTGAGSIAFGSATVSTSSRGELQLGRGRMRYVPEGDVPALFIGEDDVE